MQMLLEYSLARRKPARCNLALLPDVSEHGPLPHLPTRSGRSHHSRVFYRLRIGRRGAAHGSHALGAVSRGRSLEKRRMPCPLEPRVPLGPAAARVAGIRLADTVA